MECVTDSGLVEVNPAWQGFGEQQKLTGLVLALPLSEAVEVLADNPGLDVYIARNIDVSTGLKSTMQQTLHDAFVNESAEGLKQVHQSLFILYDMHVAQPLTARSINQFNPLLTELRLELERAWLDYELGGLALLKAPSNADELIQSINELWKSHPAANHPLFNALEKTASLEQIKVFFRSDSALNIRFFDLIVMALVGSQAEVRKELSSNFWDEAGRGDASQGHVALFRKLLDQTGVGQAADDHASNLGWQGLRGYNVFMLGALNRQHYFKSLGVMSITELLDPSQYSKLVAGCRRNGLSNETLAYYDEHISIDVVHAEGWLENVIRPIVGRTPEAMLEILKGCVLRLNSCLDYYNDLYEKIGFQQASSKKQAALESSG